jgi:hypothetical protein
MTILAQADLAASTDTLVYTAAAATTVNLLFCNRTTAPINLKVYLVPNGTSSPAVKHAIEYNLSFDGGCWKERNGIPLATGDQVFANPAAAGISMSIVGLVI